MTSEYGGFVTAFASGIGDSRGGCFLQAYGHRRPKVAGNLSGRSWIETVKQNTASGFYELSTNGWNAEATLFAVNLRNSDTQTGVYWTVIWVQDEIVGPGP